MSSFTWTSRPDSACNHRSDGIQPIAEMNADTSSSATLAVAEASLSLGAVPSLVSTNSIAMHHRSESCASSAIDGVETTSRLVLHAELAFEDTVSSTSAARVVRNLRSLTDALETPAPAHSVDYVRWHCLLDSGNPQSTAEQSNAYRMEQDRIGNGSTAPRSTSIQAPRPELIPPLLDDLDRFAMRTDLAPIVHAAIIHAQFEAIRPFAEKSGLVGRLLLQHHLATRLDLATPIPVSIPWHQDTDRYFENLRAYENGDLDSWITFAAMSVVQAVEWMLRSSEAMSSLLELLRSQAMIRPGSVAARVIDDIPQHPIVDARSVAERYGVTRQTAYEALCRLSQQDVLGEKAFARRTRTGRPRRVFSCPRFIDLLDDLPGI